jgi:hypothetical protein
MEKTLSLIIPKDICKKMKFSSGFQLSLKSRSFLYFVAIARPQTVYITLIYQKIRKKEKDCPNYKELLTQNLVGF